MEPKTIIVFGMHRSGTSLLSSVLAEMGIFLGYELSGKTKDNPTGLHEDQEILRINREILKRAGGDWARLPVQDAIDQSAEGFKADIQKLVGIRNRDHKLWGFKECRAALTFRAYAPFVRQPHFVVVHRKAEAVAQSLVERGDMDFKRGLELHAEYEARIERLLAEFPEIPRLHVSYENAIQSPDSFLKTLSGYVGLQPSPEIYQRMREIVLPPQKLKRVKRWLEFKSAVKSKIKLLLPAFVKGRA